MILALRNHRMSMSLVWLMVAKVKKLTVTKIDDGKACVMAVVHAVVRVAEEDVNQFALEPCKREGLVGRNIIEITRVLVEFGSGMGDLLVKIVRGVVCVVCLFEGKACDLLLIHGIVGVVLTILVGWLRLGISNGTSKRLKKKAIHCEVYYVVAT
ncbi:hypothetical protein HanPI659440_Chr08g0304841 [Helianthus annuus]|nr:hypothetical protein HanPI659440_Chr08g0304841 [Helianthus annuus]